MKIRNLATGIVSTERSDIAQALIRQGICEAILDRTPRAPVVPAPNYSVGARNGLVTIICQTLVGTFYFTGAPDEITDKDFGRPVSSIPAAILAEYKRAYEANPAMRDARVKYHGYATKGKVSSSTAREFDNRGDRVIGAQVVDTWGGDK